jgi:hypothetical protein
MGAGMLGIAFIFFRKSGYRKFGALAVGFCILAFPMGCISASTDAQAF